ncbi:hypothetical protein BKA56DRAFT_615219 [Ilyonectria sp. MPI-CAGE-AT-0026]|nr:hypothetical protein BKA56DRAFT_615219 [Ilyonectria sp. MPI-CAGE-AT-0026]
MFFYCSPGSRLQAHPWECIGGLVLDDNWEAKLGAMVDKTFARITWDVIPRLETFVAIVTTLADELNKVKLRLAHKDLHVANLIVDVSSSKITCVLDWEFAGIVPFTKWNTRRASYRTAKTMQRWYTRSNSGCGSSPGVARRGMSMQKSFQFGV